MPTDDVYPCPHCHGTGEVRHYGFKAFVQEWNASLGKWELREAQTHKGGDMSDINALLDRIREQAARLDPSADSEGGEQ